MVPAAVQVRWPHLRDRDRQAGYSLVAQGYGAHGSEADDATQFERQLAAAYGSSGVSCISVHVQRVASPAM
jgi:thiamine pyrophosphate-dependent acetolactate synthase large subunit-like protein